MPNGESAIKRVRTSENANGEKFISNKRAICVPAIKNLKMLCQASGADGVRWVTYGC